MTVRSLVLGIIGAVGVYLIGYLFLSAGPLGPLTLAVWTVLLTGLAFLGGAPGETPADGALLGIQTMLLPYLAIMSWSLQALRNMEATQLDMLVVPVILGLPCLLLGRGVGWQVVEWKQLRRGV